MLNTMASSAILHRRWVCGILRWANRMLSSSVCGMKSPLLMIRPDPDLEGGAMFKFWCSGTNKVYKFYDYSHRKCMTSPGGLNYIRQESFVDRSYKAVGSSQGWVAYQHHCNLFLIDPTTYRATYLPYLEILTEVHSLVLSDDRKDPKAFLISGSGHTLAFCSPGRSDEWTTLSDRAYESAVYSRSHRRLLCLATSPLELEWWDVGGPTPSLASVTKLEVDGGRRRCSSSELIVMYIACEEESGEVFVVVRHVSYERAKRHQMDPTVGFVVYRLERERERGRLVKMEGSLGGVSMFVGINDAIAIRDVEGVQPDAIYHTHDNRIRYSHMSYIGIYDYQKDDFSHVDQVKDFPAEDPLWFTPNF